MKTYRKAATATVLFVAAAMSLVAQQPVIAPGAIFNAASFAFPGLPTSGIAPGSMFTVFLSTAYPNLPNAGLTQFPLPIVFPSASNGVSMSITVNGLATDTYVYFTVQIPTGTQIGGILPSSTPVGSGTLTVTVNGVTSAPEPVNVVPSAFGTFTQNESGGGAGAFGDTNGVGFTPLNAANPGMTAVGWGTGLGGITGDESSGVRPGAVPPVVAPPGSIKIFVGGLPATFIYGGRSGGGAAEDQINFTVPTGVYGCAVPVVFLVNGVPSNFTTMPIAASGRICSDPNGFSSADLQTLSTKGSIKTGAIALNRVQYTYSGAPGLPTNTSTTDTGAATFGIIDTNTSKIVPIISQQPSPNTCTVNQLRFGNMTPSTLLLPGAALDAGTSINIAGPNGAGVLAKVPITLNYFGNLGINAPYLVPGNYTVTNANGGTDVGAVQAALTIAPPLTWTNAGSIFIIDRTKGLAITWNGGDPNGLAVIEGYGAIGTPSTGALFTCVAPVSAGTFTVPPSVLAALPATSSTSQNPSILMVGTTTTPVRFSATGLDVGYLYSTSVSGQSVFYQ